MCGSYYKRDTIYDCPVNKHSQKKIFLLRFSKKFRMHGVFNCWLFTIQKKLKQFVELLSISQRSRANFIFKAKKFWTPLFSLNYGFASVEVPFRNRTSFKWIGKPTKVTIYEIRHAPILSAKNFMLSPHKIYDQVFCVRQVVHSSQLAL